MNKFKTGIIVCLLCCLISSTVFAGNSDFGETSARYQSSTTGTVLTSTGSKNKKATSGAKWFYYPTSLYFTGDATGTYGMLYVPGLQQSNKKYAAMAEGQWSRHAFTDPSYAGWDGHAGSKGTTYTLCIRLDNLIRSGYGYTSGKWNSN